MRSFQKTKGGEYLKTHGYFGRDRNKSIEIDSPQNEYYEKISAGLGILQVLLYFSLFAFIVLSFFRNTDLITYENFYFFFKDLNASAENTDVFNADSVSYPTSTNQSFSLYRKGLAVAGNNNVTVFTATGRQTVSYSIHYQNPVAVGSGRYLLVYEMGGERYSLYNSYTQIHSGKSEFPIYGAAMSDSGMYALLSASDTHISVVSLYNDHFALINRYSKNEYVMDVAINEKGTKLALLSSTATSGLFESKLTFYTPREAVEDVTVRVCDSLALSCAFTDGGGVGILCSDRVSYVSADATVTMEFLFDGREALCAALDKEGLAVCLKSSDISQKNDIIVFDKNGKMLYNESVPRKVEQIGRFEHSIFLLNSNGLTRIDVSEHTVTDYPCITDQCSILAVDKDEVLLCSPQKADYIQFSNP